MATRKEISGSKYAILTKLRNGARSARNANPRYRDRTKSPLHPSAGSITVTANGSTFPTQFSSIIYYGTAPSLFLQSGGQAIFYSGSSTTANRRVKAAKIAATGGNLSNNDGSTGTYGRFEFMADSAAFAVRLGPTTSPYRFIVDGYYLSLSGTVTTNTGPGTIESITLDFSSAGGRAVRHIIVETQGPGSFGGVQVTPGERVWAPPTGDLLRSAILGDSYAYGSSATNLADGFAAVMADCLGLRRHMNSGSGGTGWTTSNSSYNFGERIANGDLALGGALDLIFLMGSYNDRNATQSANTIASLAGMRAVRALYPNALMVTLGVFAGATGPSAGVLAAEAGIAEAVATMADPYNVFVPISPNASDAWLQGAGNTSTPYSGTLTFTGSLSGVTSGTLTSGFNGPTSSAYTIVFSDGTAKPGVTLTNASTSVSWTGAVTATANARRTHANAGNADSYIESTGVHLDDNGTYYGGYRAADAVLNALSAI